MSDSSSGAPAAPSDLLNGTPPAAPPPAPEFRPAGFPTEPPLFQQETAVQARQEIDRLKGDKDFYAKLKAEKETGLAGPASKQWDDLHKIGWPSDDRSPEARHDADTVRRAEMEWNSLFAELPGMVSDAEKAEMRGGVVRQDIYEHFVREKDRLVRDKGFYRRLTIDRDSKAIADWARVGRILSLRPVAPR